MTEAADLHVQGRMPADLIRALRGSFLCDPASAHNASLGPEDFDWGRLGAAVRGLHRTVPGVSCLLGPLESQVRGVVVDCWPSQSGLRPCASRRGQPGVQPRKGVCWPSMQHMRAGAR